MDDLEVICPYCGQPVMVTPDIGPDTDILSIDCSVCCRPLQVHLHREPDGSYTGWAQSEHGE
ncbi:MAG: CPXCG motif-containing cysteine-rich protein [Kiritimatiellae bacterium]|nr:CPXCG motif-containing cysteine-rich protein [Kiritimatiellia bacterium]